MRHKTVSFISIWACLFLFSITYAQAANVTEVARLYVATFNRAPLQAGLDYWANDSGLDVENIAGSFFDQDETKALYPEGTSDADFVTAIYQNLFNRDPLPAGLDYWIGTGGLGGSITRDVMILAVINGAVGTDAAKMANKTEVGLYYAASGLPGRDFSLADISEDFATRDAAKLNVDNLVKAAGVSLLVLPGAVYEYFFQQSDDRLLVYDRASALIATVQVQEEGTAIIFADGTHLLSLDASGMTLGGLPVSTEAPDAAADTYSSSIGSAGNPATLAINPNLSVGLPAFPAGESVDLSITSLHFYPQPPASDLQVGALYDISLSGDAINGGDFTLKFTFDPSLLPADVPPEVAVSVVHYSEEINSWVYWPKQIDESTGTISVDTDEFSPWGWMYSLAANRELCTDEGHFCLYYLEGKLGIIGPIGGQFLSKRELAEQVGATLEEARTRYADAGFTVPDHLNVIMYEGTEEPHYRSGWIGQDTIYLSMTAENKESLETLLQTAAHELFHAVQNQHLNSFSMAWFDRKWFTEASADFAAFHIARARASGSALRNLNSTFFPYPLSTFDNSHEYLAAHFIDYLVTEKHISFYEMMIELYQATATNSIAFLETFVFEKTGMAMGDIWEGFVWHTYRNNRTSLANEILILPTDFSKSQVSLDLYNGYSAASLVLKVKEKTSLVMRPASLNISRDGLYENWARLYVYKIKNFTTKPEIEVLNTFDRRDIAPNAQFTMGPTDYVVFLVMYDRIDMPPVDAPPSDLGPQFITPDQSLRLNMTISRQDEDPDVPVGDAVTSTFDGVFAESSDRWGIGSMAPGFGSGWFQAWDVAEYHQSGGNPDGYISWVGDSGDWWYFTTYSTNYRGDRSFALGKNITFDLKTDNTRPPDTMSFIPFVVISGTDSAGKALHMFQLQYFGPYHNEEPGADWTSYAISLNAAAGWRVSSSSTLGSSREATDDEIRQILSTLTSLRIRGEYGSHRSEGALDNVVLGGN